MLKPIVSAGIEAASPKDNHYDKTFHHTPGSLGSTIGGSHLLWRPLPNATTFSQETTKPLIETVVGTMKIQIRKASDQSNRMITEQNMYLRLGCQLPLTATSGRWPRYHTTAKPKIKENGLEWMQGLEIAVVKYHNEEADVSTFPRITLSLRKKKANVFGGSVSYTNISTLAFDEEWTGPDEIWNSILLLEMHHNNPKHNALLEIQLRYVPKPSEGNAKREVEELERQLALKATYMSKIIMKPMVLDDDNENTL